MVDLWLGQWHELHAQVAALVVFQLPQPTHERPYIQGLLDPCTNSMIAPNIPAEVLYDKKVCHQGPPVWAIC